MFFAHSANARSEKQELTEHLKRVAEGSARFAAQFGASELGHWAGLWHDLGKFHPDFQAYLANPVARRGPDHKAAGALLATRWLDALAFLIQGHHGGLNSQTSLRIWLREKRQDPHAEEALRMARSEVAGLEPSERPVLPEGLDSPFAVDIFLRMLFSALVDADFLDTERHFNAGQSTRRQTQVALSELWERCERSQGEITGKRTDAVNQARNDVYEACLTAASQAPGFFRLTVPTGGGKTRSSLAFALRHAMAHGLESGSLQTSTEAHGP